MTTSADTAGQPPVITIDGPTASGKGTVAQRVATALGWAALDSGALYRLVALQVRRTGVADDDSEALAALARALDVCFEGDAIRLSGEDVSAEIRVEAVGNLASRIAALPALRAALLDRQRAFRQWPGLVADGRDMGTVVFPDAPLKIFLVAAVEARAERRYKQLKEKGFSVNLADLLKDLRVRDERDRTRASAPLVAASDAHVIDSSALSIDETVATVLGLWPGQGLQPGAFAAG